MNIAILLSTYNGSAYLKQQLDSLVNQSYRDFEIFVRDDGSRDDTLQILSAYNVRRLPDNGNVGARKSFEKLLKYAVEHSAAKYFMFCDQDDVWFPDKVQKTLTKMRELEQNYGDLPLLVHTDLEVVDEKLQIIAPSMWDFEFTLPDKNSFNRLLIQNTVTGCTAMINRRLADKCLVIPDAAIMHDWWIGLVASQFGKIGYIKETTIKYRQHGRNSIGAKGFKVNTLRHLLGLAASLIYRDSAYIKSMQINFDQARDFLEAFRGELDDRCKTLLTDFTTLEQKSFVQRRIVVCKHQLLKQGVLRNLALFVKI